MEKLPYIMLFRFRGFQQKPFINDQQDWGGIFRRNFFVYAVITSQLQFEKQIRKPAGVHPKCTGQTGLPTSGTGM